LKRRNFIKILGGSLLCTPHTSHSSFNINYLKDITDEIVNSTISFKQNDYDFCTGYQSIDNLISISNGDLVVIASRPSMGKSILVNNIAQKIARQYDVAIGYYFEDGGRSLYRRFLSSQGTIKINDLRYCEFDEMLGLDKVNYSELIRLLSELNIIVDTTRFITLEELSVSANNLVEKHGVKLLVIDSLENIYVKQHNEGFDSAVVVPFIKNLAVKLNIPIIVTSALNSNLEKRKWKYPRLTDFDNYRVFEIYADSILSLYRDCVYNESCEDANDINIIIEKSKRDARGTIKLNFDGDFARITEYNN